MTTNLNLLNNIQENITLEDQLSCLTADLLELKTNQQFLEELFKVASGQWRDVGSLCTNLDQIISELELIYHNCEDKLQVTWLDYPQSVLGVGYCLITFYLESLHWSQVSLYNKKYFDKNLST